MSLKVKFFRELKDSRNGVRNLITNTTGNKKCSTSYKNSIPNNVQLERQAHIILLNSEQKLYSKYNQIMLKILRVKNIKFNFKI